MDTQVSKFFCKKIQWPNGNWNVQKKIKSKRWPNGSYSIQKKFKYEKWPNGFFCNQRSFYMKSDQMANEIAINNSIQIKILSCSIYSLLLFLMLKIKNWKLIYLKSRENLESDLWLLKLPFGQSQFFWSGKWPMGQFDIG